MTRTRKKTILGIKKTDERQRKKKEQKKKRRLPFQQKSPLQTIISLPVAIWNHRHSATSTTVKSLLAQPSPFFFFSCISFFATILHEQWRASPLFTKPNQCRPKPQGWAGTLQSNKKKILHIRPTSAQPLFWVDVDPNKRGLDHIIGLGPTQYIIIII